MNDERLVKRRTWSIVPSLMLVWGSVAGASFLATILTSAPVPSFIDVALSRPLTMLVGLVLAALSLAWVLRNRLETVWQELLVLLPIASLIAMFLAWTGIWNDGSGTIALSLGDASLFLVTLGILPLKLGPDVIVRVTCAALAILLAIRWWRRGSGWSVAVRGLLSVWIPSAFILLVPSWIALIGGVTRKISIQNSLDAAHVLGGLLVSSYWTNFQADRFFGGIGQQFQVSVALSAASLVFLIGCFALLGWGLRLAPWNRLGVFRALARRLCSVRVLVAASSVVIGLYASLRLEHLVWNGLDVIALLVFLAVVKAWYAYWIFGRDIEDLARDEQLHPERPLPSGFVRPDELESLREVYLLVALIGACLLGWPILLGVIVLFVLGWMSSVQAFGWFQSFRYRIPVWAMMNATLVMMAGAFGSRNALVVHAVFSLALSWAILAAVAELMPSMIHRAMAWRDALIAVAVAGLLVAIFLAMPVILAVLALSLLGLFVFQKKNSRWTVHYPLFVILFGWIASVMSWMK